MPLAAIGAYWKSALKDAVHFSQNETVSSLCDLESELFKGAPADDIESLIFDGISTIVTDLITAMASADKQDWDQKAELLTDITSGVAQHMREQACHELIQLSKAVGKELGSKSRVCTVSPLF